MQTLITYLRLGLRGLCLEPEVYRQQRTAPFQQGLLLVILLGFVVGTATTLGQFAELAVSPSFTALGETVRQGLGEMPWYKDLAAADPQFKAEFHQTFSQVMRFLGLFKGSYLVSLGNILLTPLGYVIGWLLFGSFAYLFAKLLGGRATLSQTLTCTALATGANLLNAVHLVPFVQVTGVTILSFMANYIAIREAHELSPKRAFWATVLGPLSVIFLVLCFYCVLFWALVATTTKPS